MLWIIWNGELNILFGESFSIFLFLERKYIWKFSGKVIWLCNIKELIFISVQFPPFNYFKNFPYNIFWPCFPPPQLLPFILPTQFYIHPPSKRYGACHEFACHPCSGTRLICIVPVLMYVQRKCTLVVLCLFTWVSGFFCGIHSPWVCKQIKLSYFRMCNSYWFEVFMEWKYQKT